MMNFKEYGAIIADLGDLALPVLIVSVLSVAILALALRALKAPVSGALFMFLPAFAILGGISGVMAGSSFEALVGGLVTGVLGLVSALLSFGFARESDPDIRAAIPGVIILLLVNALVGLSVGQNWKKKWVDYNDKMEEFRLDYKEVWIPATREFQHKVIEKCAAAQPGPDEIIRNCNVAKLFPQQ